MITDLLSTLRHSYMELSEAFFTVNFAGDDCFVLTSLSSNPFNPALPMVDVALVSNETLAPIKMLDQASDAAMLAYVNIKSTVTAYCGSIIDTDVDFPIKHDEDAYTKYLSTLGN